MWKHIPQPTLTKQAQDQVHDASATEILMKIVKRIREVTAHYSGKKHLAEIQDLKSLKDDIKLASQELETKPLRERALEAELEYLKSALKILSLC